MSLKICEWCEGEGRYPEGQKRRIISAGLTPDDDGYKLLICHECHGTGRPKELA